MNDIASSVRALKKVERNAFRKIFDEFDIIKSGTLTAEELHACINKQAGYEALTYSEVMEVLADMDVKGTGEIEFDEFIYFMTRPQNLSKMLDNEDREMIEKKTGYSLSADEEINNRGKVLFEVLRGVLRNGDNADIKNFYRDEIINKMNDHVIDHWSNGKRCIGLSNADMMKRYEKILQSNPKNSFERQSPYAKPLMWGVRELKNDLRKQRVELENKSKLRKEGSNMKPKRVKVREMEITVKAVPLPTYKIKKDSHPDKFTYDDLKQIRINVSKLMDKYYGYLRQTANDNTQFFYGAVAIDQITNEHNRNMTTLAFQSYCNPFVIAPWVPRPFPTSWVASRKARFFKKF